MDLKVKRNELIKLLMDYFSNKSSLTELQIFSSDIIDYFADEKKNKLPSYQDFEKEFWYAIWQIQHLADIEHEREGVTARELSKALDYLVGKKKIPESFVGKRP